MLAMPPSSKQVTSPKNPIVHRFREAGQGELPDLLLAEGGKLVEEGLQAGLPVVAAAISPKLRDGALAQRLAAATGELLECSDEVLARMSGLDTHQGVAVLFERPRWREEDLVRGDLQPLAVVAAGVRDPGNLGALFRAAEAAGATGLVAMAGGADPWREKAVRGGMGSVFRLPALSRLLAPQVVEFCRRHRLQVVAADGGGGTDYLDADLRRPTALVLGAEAQGLPEELLRAADQRVRIPLRGSVESLNVAVAAGVLLFEARRQRR